MNTKRAITISAILTLAIVVGVSIFIWRGSRGSEAPEAAAPAMDNEIVENYISKEPATTDQQAGGESIKEDALNNRSTEGSYDASITSATLSGDTLYIRTSIQAITSKGTCTLKMTGPSNKVYSAASRVQALASYSTCEGFNVPISSLGVGDWDIIILYSDGSNSVTMKKEIKIP